MAKKKELTIEEKLQAALVPKEEQPYEIPNSWVWVRWKNISQISSSRRVLQSEWKKEGIPFYRAREIIKLSHYGEVDNELFISRSEEHTSELQSRQYLVCRLLLEKKKTTIYNIYIFSTFNFPHFYM